MFNRLKNKSVLVVLSTYFTSLALSLLIACGGSSKKIEFPDESETTKFDNYLGVWAQQGYGFAYVFSESHFTRYEYSSSHCLVVADGALTLFDDQIESVSQVDDSNRLQILTKFGNTFYYLNRQISLPESCTNGSTYLTTDPEINFEAFWATFNEQYAFFEVRKVDWKSQYDLFRPMVNSATTEQELFEVLSGLIAPLKDGHVSVESPFRQFFVLDSPLFEQLSDEFQNQTTITDFTTYILVQFKRMIEITHTYLIDSPSFAANDSIAWGRLNENTGYLAIYQFAEFGSNTELVVEELKLLKVGLDSAFSELSNVDELVIDLRFNTGGMDSAALEVANRIAINSRIGYSKTAKDGNGLTPEQFFKLLPVEKNGFQGEVKILISSISSSATENLILALIDRPNLTFIGEKTPGIHSDSLGKVLPNGWEFSLSNEIFRAPNGTVYEGVGVSPNIEILSLSKQDRDAQVDSVMEYLLDPIN